MAAVMIRCPVTGKAVATGIETEPSELARLPNVESWARCPHCQVEHRWTMREAWIAGEAEPVALRRAS